MRILVWDLPTRAFHWLFALSFLAAYLSSEDDWLTFHVTFGYTVLGLVAFRLLWGFAGTRYARFSSFAYGPPRALAYLRSLLERRPEHHVGHNPAGSWAIYLLLALGALTGALGFLTLNGPQGWKWVKEVHQVAGNVMLGVACVHIAGVIAGSLAHKENLARAMVDGYKEGAPAEGIRTSVWIVGAMLLALVAGFWTAAWRGDLPAVTEPAA
ncbi:MAG: cytochrome b/b6 domain-containing protein, partial [Burkholderiales bacterium]